MNLKEHYKQRLNALLFEAQVGYDPSRVIPRRPIDGSGMRDTIHQPSKVRIPDFYPGIKPWRDPRIDGSGAPRDSQGRSPWNPGYEGPPKTDDQRDIIIKQPKLPSGGLKPFDIPSMPVRPGKNFNDALYRFGRDSRNPGTNVNPIEKTPGLNPGGYMKELNPTKPNIKGRNNRPSVSDLKKRIRRRRGNPYLDPM
jgi:hypothetical protein